MQQVKNIQELKEAINANGEMVVSKNKKNNVVIMSIEEYKNKLGEDEIDKKLIRAEEQIKTGKTIKATEIFKELEEKYEF